MPRPSGFGEEELRHPRNQQCSTMSVSTHAGCSARRTTIVPRPSRTQTLLSTNSNIWAESFAGGDAFLTRFFIGRNTRYMALLSALLILTGVSVAFSDNPECAPFMNHVLCPFISVPHYEIGVEGTCNMCFNQGASDLEEAMRVWMLCVCVLATGGDIHLCA